MGEMQLMDWFHITPRLFLVLLPLPSTRNFTGWYRAVWFHFWPERLSRSSSENVFVYFFPREKNSAFIFSVFSAFLTSFPCCSGEQAVRPAEPSAQPAEIPSGGQAVPTALFPDQDTAPSTAAEKNRATSSVTSQAQAKGCKHCSCEIPSAVLSFPLCREQWECHGWEVRTLWRRSSGCLCWSWAAALAAQYMWSLLYSGHRLV